MNATKRTLFLCIIGCLLFLGSHGQETLGGRYLPPSPNSAALAKFVDLPINMHTGIPQLSIPVYSWKNEISGLSLDVSLGYHAGGVKVEEIGSNVGLGWTLNAGGVITRTVRGLPDEQGNGFLTTPELPYLFASSDGFPEDQNNNSSSSISAQSSPAHFQKMLDIEANVLDSEQDVFFYNFNGKSGKFFIGKDGSIILQTQDNLKINVDIGTYNLNRFEVIDEHGLLYIFNAVESTTSRTLPASPGSILTYNSSWYLTEIRSADGNTKLRFEYQLERQIYNTGYSEQKSVAFEDTSIQDRVSPGTILSHTSTYSMMDVFAMRIKKIRLPDSTHINFSYHNVARTDLSGGHSLSRISVVAGENSFGYDLVHDYLDNRLQLMQLNKFGGDQQEKPYVFSYVGGLPSQNSMYQDYWGYAIGGQRNINTRISNIYFPTITEDFAGFLMGDDRRPDPVAVLAGSLYKIVYPTGGSTIYEMECNEAFDQTHYYTNLSEVGPIQIDQTAANSLQDFNLSGVGGQELDFRLSLIETYREIADPDQPVWWRDTDIDRNPLTITLRNATNTWSMVLFNGKYGDLISNTIKLDDVVIPAAGMYKVYMEINTAYPIMFYATVSATYFVEPTHKYVGGLRAKRVLNYLDANATVLASSKSFSYMNENNVSSGKLSVVPNFSYYKTATLKFENCGGFGQSGTLRAIGRGSESTQPLGSVQGSPVGYTRVTVTEMDGTNAVNGKTVYEFTPLNYIDGISTFPFRHGEYISWGAGLPLKESVYNAGGSLLRMIENQYDVSVNTSTSASHLSLKVGRVFSDNCDTFIRKQFAVLPGYPVYGISLKQLQRETVYENGLPVEKLRSYTYDPLYKQTRTITENTSAGSRKTKLYYPYDFMGMPVFVQMVSDNRIGQPVKTEEWKNDDDLAHGIIAAQATSYGYFGSAIRPVSTHELVVDGDLPSGTSNSAQLLFPGTYRTKEVFHSYHTKGGPLAVSYANGPTSTLIWHNDGLKPKALFVNAEASEVYIEDFEVNGNYGDNVHTGILAYSGSFLPPFMRPNGKNYVITYFTWNGTKWTSVPPQPYNETTSLSGIIDNVMIYPETAHPSKSFTYFPLWGLRDILEPWRLQRYEYDKFGRLTATKDHNGHIIKAYDYHYKP